jgi:hypothetical protein
MGNCIGGKRTNPNEDKNGEKKALVPPQEQREPAKVQEPKEEVKKLEGGDRYRPENLKESNGQLANPASNQSQLSGSRKDTLKPKLNLEEIEPDRLRRTEGKDLKNTKLQKTSVSRINDAEYLVKEKEGVRVENRVEDPFVNSGRRPGFEHPDLQEKCIQPLQIRTTIDNMKLREQESAYNDETRGAAEVLERNNVMLDKAELVADDLPELKMGQIKTYLFDRSLASRLTE